jgi:ribosomal protein S18 acetylase RimI-like enzyme
MSHITIRDIEEKDLPVLKSLIAEAFGEGWNLRHFEQNEDFMQALLDVYLSIFLSPSTFGRVAVEGDEVVGVVLCSVSGEAEKFRIFHKDIAPNTLTLMTATEAERMHVAEHMTISFQTIGQLLENSVDTYDGSLELLVVTERAQGMKIGKTLWDEAADYFKSKNAKSIYLIADSTCNVGFYDNNGFTKAEAKEAVYNYTTGQRKTNVFVYEYKF